MLQQKNPKAEVLDAERGTCRNGRRRGSNMTSCDFRLDGRKVEVKSARMAWISTKGRWYVQLFGVKLAYGARAKPAFDDLYLVIMSPKGLHLVKHDLVTGVSTRGKATEVGGHRIKVYGRTGTGEVARWLLRGSRAAFQRTRVRKDCKQGSFSRPSSCCRPPHVQYESGKAGQTNTGNWPCNRPCFASRQQVQLHEG